jgi:hypothetical protein
MESSAEKIQLLCRRKEIFQRLAYKKFKFKYRKRKPKHKGSLRLCKHKPGWAPSSMTCNLEVICPALSAFEAKQIRVDGFSLPTTWKRISSNIHKY